VRKPKVVEVVQHWRSLLLTRIHIVREVVIALDEWIAKVAVVELNNEFSGGDERPASLQWIAPEHRQRGMILRRRPDSP
jgi:hypothetical protein